MLILVINPGSISLKIAVYRNRKEIFSSTILNDQLLFKNKSDIKKNVYIYVRAIRDLLQNTNFNLSDINVVVGRGGLLRPLKGGVYKINAKMVDDLHGSIMGEHPSNYGALIANEFSRISKSKAFIVDPVVVDEMEPVARISGLPMIERKSIFHALNQKAVARKVANRLGKPYNELNLIIVHMGGGITVGCHRNGQVIDVNNGLDGEGPLSPERSGTLPAGDLIDLCFSGQYSKQQIKSIIKGQGGLTAYLETNDVSAIENRIKQKDKHAALIYQAMVYQICKEVGALSTVLKGEVDAIALTGGLAKSKKIVQLIKKKIAFIAPVYIYAGEFEMEAMAMGALRAITGEEKVKYYN